MTPIEQRVRESLRARAEDAEPTPQLYRGVQDRIARRRRLKLMAWVPAGAAALGVAVAVPLLLSGGPEVPNIEDFAEEQPQSTATTPDRAVVLDHSGELSLVELTDGSSTQPYDDLEIGGMLPEIAVAPSDRSAVPVLHTALVEDRPEGAMPVFGYRAAGRTGTVDAGPTAAVEGRFAVSADGGWVAALAGPTEDADGWALHLYRSPSTGDEHVVIEPGIVVPVGSVVQDWTGSPDADGGVSQVTVVTPERRLIGIPLTAGDGAFTWDEERIEQPVGAREVAAYASSHLADGRGFVLETGDDGAVVQAVDGEEILGQVDVSELVGGQDPSTFALDAWGDTAALSTPEGSWLLRHDGDGAFLEPVALPDGTVRAALVGRDVAAAPEPEPEPDPEPMPDVTPPDEEPDDSGVVDEVQEAELPGAVVVTDLTSVVLRRPDGSETDLMRFPASPDGEGTMIESAVRPGSTPDDLTVAVATQAEGVTDLRWVDVIDGEVQDHDYLDGAYRPASADDPAVRLDGLAWTPDGSKLLWLERSDDGTATLRSIGWSDGPGTGDTATDNTGFEVPGGFTTSLVDVVDGGGGRLVARFTNPDDNQGWYRWILEVQGDGALAVPAGSEPELVTSPVSQGGVAGLAGADEESRPTWLLIAEFDGPRLVADPFGDPRDLTVPAELMPDDGLPYMRVHELGDGALVGGAGQAWFVDADGWVDLGDAVDADPVR